VTPSISTPDGLRLHAHLWEGRSPRGLLIVSHGLGEHVGCYEPLARTLTAIPGLVDVLVFDYRGHGKSPGRRGVVRSVLDLRIDLRAALDWAARERPGARLFVLGHSNGGQVALHVALEAPGVIGALVLSNPNLALAAKVPRWKQTLGRLLDRVAPWVTLPTLLDDALMTRDAAAWPVRKADPLRHTRIGPRLYFGMIEGGRDLVPRAGQVRIPTLMLLGAEDPVVDVRANRAFFDRLGAEDRTLIVYPGMLHEPLHEIGRERVYDDVACWIAGRLVAGGLPERPS